MEEKSYKFGIIVYKTKSNGRKASVNLCSCGQHSLAYNYSERYQCDNCANSFFIDARGKHTSRFVIPYLESQRKDNRGFKVRRTNLSVIYDGDTVVPVKENLVRIMEYDIVDKVLKVWRNDELEYDSTTNSTLPQYTRQISTRFFTQLEMDTFLDFVSNEVTRDMFTCVVRELSINNSWGNSHVNVLNGLVRLMNEYSHLQILANAGLPKVDRFFAGRYRSNREDTIIDETKTKPHEILKMPKFMMAYLREDTSINRSILQQLQGQLSKLDANKFREIMSIVKDESTMKDLSNSIDTIMTIHIDYDYTNLKKLILYLFREVRLTQGIDSPSNASTYLRDYIRMSDSMKLDWDKYPKSLKKEHDVVLMNYKVVNAGKEKQELFKMSVERKSYQRLAFKNKKHEYAIVTPSSSEDLIKEGNQLSHCVASYVNDVTNDKCKILFLRDAEDLETPLATIEVRGMNIRQARGFANRPISEEQKEFIKFWAEKNGLVENYY